MRQSCGITSWQGALAFDRYHECARMFDGETAEDLGLHSDVVPGRVSFRPMTSSKVASMSPNPPLMLLHGVTNSARIWDEVAPLLRDEFELIVPTATGHRGGARKSGLVTIEKLVDEAEETLDREDIAAAHLAGNSMGGWMAIELARRGRALSVCAISPAGCWTPGEQDEVHATATIRKARRLARMAAPLAPIALRSSRIRAHTLRAAASHGDRITASHALEIARDLVGCTAAHDLLGTPESLATLDPLPCPITLAWAAEDQIFPPTVNGRIARNLIPDATYLELENVGHVPMIDDPALCAEVIKKSVQRAGLT